MALGALWVLAKYSYRVWEQFAQQASTFLKKTKFEFVFAVRAMPSIR